MKTLILCITIFSGIAGFLWMRSTNAWQVTFIPVNMNEVRIDISLHSVHQRSFRKQVNHNMSESVLVKLNSGNKILPVGTIVFHDFTTMPGVAAIEIAGTFIKLQKNGIFEYSKNPLP